MTDYDTPEEYEAACTANQQRYGREIPATGYSNMPSRGYCIAYILIPVLAFIAAYYLH